MTFSINYVFCRRPYKPGLIQTMKHISRYLVALVFIVIAAVSCSKDSDNPQVQLAAKPEAEAAYNTQSGGVYKGVIIGSTGSIKIVLQGGKLVAEVTIDGVTKTLTANNLQSWTSGQAIDSAAFVNGDWSIVFSVNADGTEAEVTATIPGHDDITVIVAKETSEHQILAYEGTYTVDTLLTSNTEDSVAINSIGYEGTWNFISQDSKVAGIYRSVEGEIYPFVGTIENGTIYAGWDDLEIYGLIKDDKATGYWFTEVNGGKFSGKRKL